MPNLIAVEVITSKIFVIRNKRVMLDRDLALLYGVTTKRLNEQVKRNRKRFPEDFMFQLTRAERNELVAICDRFNTMKHSTTLPYVFTEQGVAMLSGILSSDRAIAVNIQIMRAFVKLRRFISAHKKLAGKLKELEKKFEKHDQAIENIFEAIRRLIQAPDESDRIVTGFSKN